MENDLTHPLSISLPSDTSSSNNHWVRLYDCCFCGPLIKFQSVHGHFRYFLRHWECTPCMPITVTILTVFCITVHFVSVVPHLSLPLALISCFLILFFGSIFLSTYFMASCMDPGFLPFTWIESRRFWYSWEEQLNGLAETSDQFEFARAQQNRPPGCSFSAAFGRYVIRADHICGWIGNWVGKRNHKQFMLFNFYGFWLGISLFVFKIIESKPSVLELPTAEKWMQLITMGVEALFGLSMIGVFVQLLTDLSQNRTKIQRMRNASGGQDYSCEESMREVCGEGSMICWICPRPAFDESLVIRDDDEHSMV
jgi:hypothetical protein